jgi:hypothetical protein
MRIQRYFPKSFLNREFKMNSWILASSILILMACAGHQKQEEILAIVGNRVITVDEFMRRAEYTIRPPYCRMNSNTDKSTVLNSLVAEKLYAFEAGDSNAFERNVAVQAYIRGRKEQIMRQCLFDDQVKGQIQPNRSEIDARFKLAGREYRLAYFTTDRNGAQAALGRQINLPGADCFDDLYKRSGGLGPPPERAVSWKSQEHPAVHKALFSEPLNKDQVVGPIQLDEDTYLMVKVLGWTDLPAVSDAAIRQRFEEVINELEREKGEAVWNDYIFKIMKNKRLEFQRETFEKMVALMRPLYIVPKKTGQMKAVITSTPTETPAPLPTDSILAVIKNTGLENRPFFTFDGRTWTVKDFLRARASHPLVFRKEKITPDQFREQFKLAVADLLRDEIVNQKAYAKGLDKSPVVVEYTNMWRDALVADYDRYAFLKSKGADADSIRNFMAHITKYLKAHSDSLFKKYSPQIQIHIPNFNKIKLTRIDMVAQNQNVPYRQAVPDFPLLTTKSQLDYGRKLE